MPQPQATVTYPGLVQYESVQATMAIGKTPGIIQIQIAPTQLDRMQVQQNGDLVIQDGPNRVKFVDCLAISSAFSFDEGGMVIGITLRDFRHRWQYPTISGTYNMRNDKAEIVMREGTNKTDKAIINTERSPEDLLQLCLNALGVKKFDTSRAPNPKARPYVNWYYTNAADALQEVCDAIGAVICAQPDGSVSIWPYYQGRSLPLLNLEQYSKTYTPPQLPYAIKIACGPTRYAADLPLIPVGKDKDGKWKEINDLSYKPTGGWEAETDIINFHNIPNKKLAELATAHIWKCYWVKTPVDINVYGEVKYREQFELETEQVTQAVTDARGTNLPAVAYGVFNSNVLASRESVAQTLGLPYTADAIDTLPEKVRTDLDKLAQITVPYGFSIETTSEGVSIVRFSDPVTLVNTSNLFTPPRLFLRCAVRIRNPDTRAFDAYERERIVNVDQRKLNNTAAKCIVHSEINLAIDLGNLNDNKQEVNKECDYYIDAALKEFLDQSPESAPYIGINPIQLDGAIQSLTWIVDGRGPTTIINRNQDNGTAITPSYRERYRNEKIKALIDKAYNQTAVYAEDQVKSGFSAVKVVRP